MKQTILVTGGAGYIGAVATEILLSEGYRVVVLDNLSTGHKEALFDDVPFYNTDVGNVVTLKKIFTENKIDLVFHFAGAASVPESMTNPLKYFDVNFCQAQRLLDVMILFDVKKIVFSSSCAVYGIPKVEEIPIKEDTKTKPISPYGESKLVFEKALEWYKKAYDLDYVSLRYFNVAGASRSRGEKHIPETHLIPLVIRAAKDENYQLLVYGDDYQTEDGTAIRDYIHVVDLIYSHLKALEVLISQRDHADVYNVGYGHGYSVFEIIKAAKEVLKREVKYKVSTRRIGDPPILVGDSTKIRKDLNWVPQYDDIYGIINSAC